MFNSSSAWWQRLKRSTSPGSSAVFGGWLASASLRAASRQIGETIENVLKGKKENEKFASKQNSGRGIEARSRAGPDSDSDSSRGLSDRRRGDDRRLVFP
jgi:hypothetical protein